MYNPPSIKLFHLRQTHCTHQLASNTCILISREITSLRLKKIRPKRTSKIGRNDPGSKRLRPKRPKPKRPRAEMTQGRNDSGPKRPVTLHAHNNSDKFTKRCERAKPKSVLLELIICSQIGPSSEMVLLQIYVCSALPCPKIGFIS